MAGGKQLVTLGKTAASTMNFYLLVILWMDTSKLHCTNGTCFHMNPDYGNVLEGPFFRDFYVTDSLCMFGKARKCN